MGYAQADGGFLATSGTANNYNSIQAPTGGMYANSFTALKYINSGSSAGVPTVTTGDSFHGGAQFWDTSQAVQRVYDGSTWRPLGPLFTTTNDNTGIRSLAVTYTNNNNKPMQVAVSITSTGAFSGSTCYVNGSTIVGTTTLPSGNQGTVTFMVPPGSTYICANGGATLIRWIEWY